MSITAHPKIEAPVIRVTVGFELAETEIVLGACQSCGLNLESQQIIEISTAGEPELEAYSLVSTALNDRPSKSSPPLANMLLIKSIMLGFCSKLMSINPMTVGLMKQSVLPLTWAQPPLSECGGALSRKDSNFV